MGVLLSLKYVSSAIDSSYAVDNTMKYKWEILTEISLTIFGSLYNGICLHLLLTLDRDARKSMSFYSLNVALSAVDMIFLISRFTAICFVLSYRRFDGGDNGAVCSTSTFFVAFCAFWSICIVVGISYVARHNLYKEKRITERDMCKWVAVTGLGSLILTITCMYVPGGGPGLDSSGSFCFLKLYSYTSTTIYFGLGFGVIYGLLLRNLLQIYIAVSNAQKILKEHSVEGYAKVKYIKMVLKLSYFFIGMNVCYLPILIAVIYELSMQQYILPTYSAFCAIFSCLNSSMLNPTLLLYLNYNVWNQFVRKYWIVGEILQHFRIIRMRFVTNRNRVGSLIVYNQTTEVFKNMENWVNDADLWKIFTDFGKKQYVGENLSFFDEARAYRSLGEEILHEVESEEDLDEIIRKWIDLETQATRIYTLYIKVSLLIVIIDRID